MNRELIDAAKCGDTERLREAITKGANINFREPGSNGHTALTWAARYGHREIVRKLVSSRANVNQENNNGHTALILAAVNGHTETVRELLLSGANVNQQNTDRYTALIYAAGCGHTDTVRELLSSEANVKQQNNDGYTALICAAENGHTETVKELLSSGANVNQKNHDGYTALIRAASNGHTDTVRELLSLGANVNQKNNNGYTALIWAAANNATGTVRELLLSGANENHETNDGDTALICAAKRGHTDTVRELLSKANVNQKNKNGQTALIWAAENGHTHTVRELLSSGADVEQEDEDGHTALICAAKMGHTDTVRKLLSLKANVNQKNKDGYTALICAAKNSHTETVRELLSLGANVNQEDNLSPIPHPVSVHVLPKNWEEVTNKEINGPLYRNSKTSAESISLPVGYPLLQDPSYPNVTFFDEPQEAVLSSSGGHFDFDNGAEITVPPDAVQPGGKISVNVQPSFAPKDVFVMPSDIHSASGSYLITSTGSKLNKDITITLEHHVNTDKDASSLLFLQASTTPTVSDSSQVYEYKKIPDSDARADFPRGKNSGRLTTRQLLSKFLKVGHQTKVNEQFNGSRSSRVATKDRLLEPASPKHQLSDLNRYTVRVYRSPIQTTGDRVAIVAVCLCGRLYANFLKKLDSELIPQDYPEVSSKAADRTTSGPYSFTEPEAKLTVISPLHEWTVDFDTDTILKCGVDFPETENFRPEELHDYPPRIVCRFDPSDQAFPRWTGILSFTGFDKDVKFNVPFKAPKSHLQKKVDTKILLQEAAESQTNDVKAPNAHVQEKMDTSKLEEVTESLKTTAVRLKEEQVVPTVNNNLSLTDMMTNPLDSSTLEDLATQLDFIKSEVQTIVDVSRKNIEECTDQILRDDIKACQSKINTQSHLLCFVTKLKLKKCQDQSEKEVALNDLINNVTQLMNSVRCLLSFVHTLYMYKVTSSGTKQHHQSGPPLVAMKTRTSGTKQLHQSGPPLSTGKTRTSGTKQLHQSGPPSIAMKTKSTKLHLLIFRLKQATRNSEFRQLKLAAWCVGLAPGKLEEVHDISDLYSSLEKVFGTDDAISILYLCLMEIEIDAETVRKLPVNEKRLENWKQNKQMKFALMVIGICNQIAGEDCKQFIDLWKGDIRETSVDIETLFKYLFQHRIVWLDSVERLEQVLGDMGNQVCMNMVENYQCSIKPLRQETPQAPASTSSLSILNITALQNEFKLTDKQIDCPIEERDLFYLGGLFGPWKDYTGVPGLGLSLGEQYTILTDCDLIDNQKRFQAVLRTWQSHNPLTATFRKLLNIVLELNDIGVAKNICQYITSKPSSIG